MQPAAKDFQGVGMSSFMHVHTLRVCVSVSVCVCARAFVKGEKDDRGPGGTASSVADSTPFSFYY